VSKETKKLVMATLSRHIKRAGRVTRGEVTNIKSFLHETKGRSWHRREDNIKTDLTEIMLEIVD
jgi:hypothetical protein